MHTIQDNENLANQDQREKDELDREIVKIKSLSLEQMLKTLIANRERIMPEQVTLEYIREQRRHRFYRVTRYNIDSPSGGYSTIGLDVFTCEELNHIQRQIDEEIGNLIHNT